MEYILFIFPREEGVTSEQKFEFFLRKEKKSDQLNQEKRKGLF